ncbi:MAG: serine hydrolase domain-containing protein [Prosthecobacter sp.]
MNRRHFVRHVGQVSAFTALAPAWAASLRKPSKDDAETIRSIAEDFLLEHGIEGMAVAYGRDGEILFEAGYGSADADGKEPVTPEHRFRIASVSKPITATAVMMSVEKGLLQLDSKVFGPQGILGDTYGRHLPESVRAITVDHLLTHTSGGWANDKNDPMFIDPKVPQDELIKRTLAGQKQTHDVGTHYAYSNFGYCVLGRVLEKVTKLPYETLITRHMLAKCGIQDMRVAGNTLAGRQPREVMYLTEKPGAAYGMNVPRMDAHGGWIATAGDLVRFASQLPKLLKEDSIRTMTSRGPAGGGYARGWSVNDVPNWWHGGSLPGTSTILVRTAKGLCWAGLLNRRTEGIGLALDRLMWRMAGAVQNWET